MQRSRRAGRKRRPLWPRGGGPSSAPTIIRTRKSGCSTRSSRHSSRRTSLARRKRLSRSGCGRSDPGKAPKFLLAELGDLKMRKARSGFVTNFLGCGGFDVYTESFGSAEEAAAGGEAGRCRGPVLVGYRILAACAGTDCGIEGGGVEAPVIVAGYPQDSLEALKAAGVADFIHVRSNALETLKNWQNRLGVKE